MRLPRPRGSLSDELAATLAAGSVPPSGLDTAPDGTDDLQLSLWILYELHYRGFDEVDDRLEWEPGLLSTRAGLEARFEDDLRRDVASVRALADGIESSGGPGQVPAQLAAIAAHEGEDSMARFLQRDATTEQYLEFLVQRSLYHLKESDPHAWAVPRLEGPPKVALAELQYDEFGAGRPDRLHSRLFADALEESGLHASYGAHVDRVPAHTLAVNNAMSLFGLHRRLRGAAMGHLAAFEMTSPLACRRYLQGADRLGLGPAVRRYFDEHVEADAVHEEVAARDICGALVHAEPGLLDDVLLGAAVCVHLDDVAAAATIADWTANRSSLVDDGGRSAA